MEIFKLFGSIFIDNDRANESIDDTDQRAEGLSGRFGKLGTAAGAVGGLLGGALVAGLGAAAAGVGALFFASQDLQKTLNGMQAATGSSDKEMQGMEQSLKNIYKGNYGESFQDIADSMTQVKQTTGLAGGALEDLTKNALLLRDTFGYEVNESVKSADKLMKQFGLTGDEAMALIAEGSQKGLNYADDLLPTIDEYSVYFKQAGFSASEMFGLFENAKNNGTFNLDYAADAVKEFGILMTENGGTATDALNGMGLAGEELQSQFAKGGEGAKKALQTVAEALAAQKDPNKQYTDGVALFGTKFEDVGAQGILSMLELNDSIKGSKDVLDDINEVKYDTIGESLRGLGRTLLVEVLEPFQAKIMPKVNEFTSFITRNIPTIQSYFAGLGDKIGAIFDKFSPAFETAKGAIAEMVPIWKQSFQTVVDVVGPLLSFIGDKFVEVINLIVGWWQSNGSELLSNFQIVFQGIWSVIQFIMPAVLAVISMIFENIKGVFSGALNIISGLFKIFAGLFTGDWSKLWDGVKQLLSGAVEFIWNAVQLMFIGRILTAFKGFVTNGISALSGLWTRGVEIFRNLASSAGSTVSGMVSKVVGYFTNLLERAKTIFETARAFGANKFSALKDAVVNTAQTLLTNTIGKFNQLKDRIGSILGGVSGVAKNAFSKVQSALTGPVDKARSAISTAIEKIKGYFSGLSLKLPNIKTPHFKIKNWSNNPIDWLDAKPSIGIDWYAKGTNYADGGLSVVGEHGPELLNLPRGSKVKTASETRAILKQKDDYSEMLRLLQNIADNIGNDIYMSDEKVGSVIDNILGTRTNLVSRRVAQ